MIENTIPTKISPINTDHFPGVREIFRLFRILSKSPRMAYSEQFPTLPEIADTLSWGRHGPARVRSFIPFLHIQV